MGAVKQAEKWELYVKILRQTTPRKQLVRSGRWTTALGLPLLAVLWFATLPALLRGQTNSVDSFSTGLTQYVQTPLTSHNGLPQNSVRSLAQTSDGYVWLATEEGLVRYDGYRTRIFDRRSDPILGDNFIRSVAAAPDGSIWVETRRGVSHYSHGHFISNAGNSGTSLDAVTVDGRGIVWVASGSGLFTVDAGGNNLVPFQSVPRNTAVRQMALAGDGSLWLATSSGVWHVVHGEAHRHGANEGLPETEIRALTIAHDGSLWCATPTELLHWKIGLLSRRTIDSIAPHGRISALLEDGGGKLWIGMEHDGLTTIKGDTMEHFRQQNGLPSDAVSVLLVDRDKNLWMGFNGGGAVRFHSGLFRTYGDREGLIQKNVFNALSARDGSVWTAMPHVGLAHLFPGNRIDVLTAREGLPPGEFQSLFEDGDLSIWAGNDQGALVHIQSGNRVTVFHNPRHAQDVLRCIVRGPDGDLFLLYHTRFGLERFRNGQFYVEPHNIPGVSSAAVRVGDGSLWIGTDQGGISHWDHQVLQMFGPRQGFHSEFVLSMAASPDGSVWIGTSPAGLSLIRNGRVTTFTPENGLFDDTVGSITDDNLGNIWMTSNKGIFKVSKAEMFAVAAGTAKSVHSIVYGPPDGLRSAECNYGTSPSASLASDGRMWFANTEGLVSVRPASSTIRSSRPMAVMEEPIVDGKPLSPQALATTAGTHDVEFDFAAPDFAAPERLHYRYKLDGFDGDWIESGRRTQAFYNRLPPGHYTLLVEAEDGSGWPDQPAALQFDLSPHFWQTTWFRGAGALLLLLTAFLVYQGRVFALRRGQRILQEQVIVRTAELQEAMREAEAAHQELQELATRDSLTRLWNRGHIFNMLSNEANRAEREDLGLCVLMLDVDHFKSVNDSRGHLAGDRVLQAVSNVLIEQTRPYDCAGRFGGEEFLVILCNCTLENGIKRADMIRDAIARTTAEWNGVEIGVTASFGVALHKPGKTVEAVLQEADEALYLAKQSGRNRVCTVPQTEAEADVEHEVPVRGRMGRRTPRLLVPAFKPA